MYKNSAYYFQCKLLILNEQWSDRSAEPRPGVGVARWYITPILFLLGSIFSFEPQVFLEFSKFLPQLFLEDFFCS